MPFFEVYELLCKLFKFCLLFFICKMEIIIASPHRVVMTTKRFNNIKGLGQCLAHNKYSENIRYYYHHKHCCGLYIHDFISFLQYHWRISIILLPYGR